MSNELTNRACFDEGQTVSLGLELDELDLICSADVVEYLRLRGLDIGQLVELVLVHEELLHLSTELVVGVLVVGSRVEVEVLVRVRLPLDQLGDVVYLHYSLDTLKLS